MSKYAKTTYWLKNSETGQVLSLSENQFSAFGVNLKDPNSKWSLTEEPKTEEKKVQTNSSSNKKEVFFIEKDGERIRVNQSQVPIFKNQGWEISKDQSDIEGQVQETTVETDEDDVEVSNDDIVNFLAQLNPDDDDLWLKDGTVAQKVLDNHFGKSVVSKDKVQEVWEGFNKTLLSGN